MTKKTDVLWTTVPLTNGQNTAEVQRPLFGVEFEPELFNEIIQFENHGELQIGKLDELQAKYWPFLNGRTALNLVVVTREIAKECMWRYLEKLEEIENIYRDIAEREAGEDW